MESRVRVRFRAPRLQMGHVKEKEVTRIRICPSMLTNLAVAGWVWSTTAGLLLSVSEADQGSTDLNGDGDTDDTVLDAETYDGLFVGGQDHITIVQD